MNDDKISNNEAINAALHLDGDPERVRKFYQDWAQNYNLDTTSSDYTGPAIMAKLLTEFLSDRSARLLDAGCGTGLVGVELQSIGFDSIDGFDLTDAMAEQATATGAYQRVLGGVDMMRASEEYPDTVYDSVLSVGVFTLGHVPPEALNELLSLTRSGGLLLISTRTHYYDQTNFQRLVDDLIASGQIELLRLLRDAPYNVDGDGHYWVFKKT